MTTRDIWLRWIGVDSPTNRGTEPPWPSYGWAIASVVVCTLIDHALFGRTSEINLAMVYLLGILPVALRGNPGAALAAAVLSVAAFDFFFVHPFLTFAVSDTQYLFTFLVMGLVGGTISTLTARLAGEISETRQRERRANALYELSQTLLSARGPLDVLAEGARVIGQELGQPVGAWLCGPQDVPVPAADSATPLSASEYAVLCWVLQQGSAAGPGTETLRGSAYFFLPVRTERHVHAALAVRLSGGTSLSPEIRATLETGANQLAIALEEARAREDADAAQRQAESERLRSALLSSVSHDLRTPLTGIVGSASTLVEGAEALSPDVRRELAQGIVEEAERLNRLVSNLLQATRLDAGALRIGHEWFPVEEAIAPALSRLKGALASHPVSVDLPPDLPMLRGDVVLLEQALTNLLENAAKYTPPGTPIELRARREGNRLWLEIADRGPGFPEGGRERLFEKFSRLGDQGTAGAGLGLAIVRGIVTAHGGAITAENRPQGGAVFRLWLPIAPAPGTGSLLVS